MTTQAWTLQSYDKNADSSPTGHWTADYVRLRFGALLTAAAGALRMSNGA
ncbi:MAG TPA: hypothetical protein VME42_06650 [Steroidobacteraceae bacterium]|nr:hypothetical protein [Steroidobacteraceae bacterium]